MNISILIPSRNGVEFLQWSYASICKNKAGHSVEILVLDDISDKDNTWEWCESTMKSDPDFKAFKNETGTRFGISGGYKYLSQFATKDVICHWHNDMFMTIGTLDSVENALYEDEYVDIGYGDGWTNKKAITENVVCLTRIEPPIYGKPGLYPEKIVWYDAPIDVSEWDEDKFNEYMQVVPLLWEGKTTEGHFAPFFMFTEQYLELGLNDTIRFPKQAREDSDVAFRLILAEFKTIQIPHFVYHFASRGNRRSKHEAGNFTDNPEWQKIDIRSTREFVRKWQTFHPLHDKFYKPRKPVRYKTTFVVKNTTPNFISIFEPWADYIDCDLDVNLIDEYIKFEQPNTSYDLDLKFYGLPDISNIKVEIDCNTLNLQSEKYITELSQIIEQDEQLGQFTLGNLKITINDLTHYEKDLIVCK